MPTKRVGISLILIAVTALLTSGLATLPFNRPIVLYQNSSESFMFHALGDISVNLTTVHGEGNYNIYIIDSVAFQLYQENGTLDQSASIFFAADLVNYTATISLPGPGDYGFVLEAIYEEVYSIEMHIANVWPPAFVPPFSATLVITGIILLAIDWYTTKGKPEGPK